jgi:hypothetical protein
MFSRVCFFMKAVNAWLLPILNLRNFEPIKCFFKEHPGYRVPVATLAMREGPHTHAIAHLLFAGVPRVGLNEDGSFRFIVALTH